MTSILATVWKLLHLPKNVQLFVMRLVQNQFLVGATGIIFNKKKEVLLFKHTYRTHAWSLPGGYLHAGEHPAEALEREIQEESNLIVSVDEPLKTRTDRTGSRLDLCYVGILIGGDFIASKEVSAYGFFSLDAMPLLRSNQVFLIQEAYEHHYPREEKDV